MGVISSTLYRGGAALVAAGLCLAAGGTAATAATTPTTPAATTAATTPAATTGTTKASVTLSGPSSATYGSTVKLTGIAYKTGTSTKLVNATIWLQKAAHNTSGWVNVVSAKTSSTGAFTFTVQLNTPYDYRARYGGSATYTVAVSPRVFPIVRQNVVFDSIKDVNWELGTMQVGGRVYPTPVKGTRIWLQRYNPSTKAWSNFMSTLTTGGNAFLMKGNFGGNVGTYRIYAPQHGYYAYNYSRQVSFAHYKWRGAFTKPVTGSPDGEFHVYTASESPTRSEMEMRAADSPATYVVINTGGCKTTTVGALNYTNDPGQTPATARVRVLNGSTHLRGPWTLGPGQDNYGSANLPNIASMKVQQEGLSGATPAYVYYQVRLLCSN